MLLDVMANNFKEINWSKLLLYFILWFGEITKGIW